MPERSLVIKVTAGKDDPERCNQAFTVAAAAVASGVPVSLWLTGFENHQGVTRLGPQVRPLARTALGTGNGDGTEGAYAGRVLGTYLHGPALVRNPGLADLLLGWVVGTLPPVDPRQEDLVLKLRADRLAAQGVPA